MSLEETLDILPFLYTKEIYAIEESALQYHYAPLEEPALKPVELLILFHNDTVRRMTEDELEVIDRLIGKISIPRNAVLLMNSAQEGLSFPWIKTHLSPKNIIAFGTTPDQIGLNLEAPQNLVLPFYGFQIVFTQSILRVDRNPQLKKQIWSNAILKMFNARKEK